MSDLMGAQTLERFLKQYAFTEQNLLYKMMTALYVKTSNNDVNQSSLFFGFLLIERTAAVRQEMRKQRQGGDKQQRATGRIKQWVTALRTIASVYGVPSLSSG